MAKHVASLDSDLMRTARGEQLNLLCLANKLFASIGIPSAALLTVDFRHDVTAAMAAIIGLIVLFYLLLFIATLQRGRGGDDRIFLWRSVALLGLLGTCWGVLLNALLPAADPPQRGLLEALAVGFVSTPLITAPEIAAAIFWCPSAASGVLLLVRGRPFDPYILVCFLGYLGFTVTALVLWNRFTLERSIGRIVQQRQNETINVFLRSYEEGGSDWLWETDADDRLGAPSARFREVAALAGERLAAGRLLPDLFPEDDGPEGRSPIVTLLDEQAAFRDLVLRVGNATPTRWWSVTGRPIFDAGGTFRGYRGVGKDVTEIRQAERQIRHLAHHDSLTGLANRATFMGALEQVCFDDGDPARGTAALFLLDLDRFKNVNDTLGHPAGDALLCMVAERLRTTIRSEVVIARLGGDEFGVLCEVRDEEEAITIARRLVARVSTSYELAGTRQSIGLSVGAVLIDQASRRPDVALQHADLALYAAKEGGRGDFQLFRPSMLGQQPRRVELNRALELAIRAGGLHLVYQPVFDLQADRVAAVEALCRWRHPTLGDIAPATFIPLAEENGLIVELGDWVLGEACRAAQELPAPIRVAVNVSPIQIKSGQFLQHLERALAQSGLAAQRLDLEVTEQTYLDAAPEVLDTLQGLRAIGCHLTLDDFGVGYSALSYLAAFPFDAFKLDADFMRGVAEGGKKAAIVRAVVGLAGELGLQVTAEGIETAEQKRMLEGFGIRYAQGFGLARPMGMEKVAELLAAAPVEKAAWV